VGEFAGVETTSDGTILSNDEWLRRRGDFLPNEDDGAFIASLMKPCWEKGKYAHWIAPPKVGIDNKPGDFEYVKIPRA
jgi:benzoyl-CoA 2,3-dioxygenase component B